MSRDELGVALSYPGAFGLGVLIGLVGIAVIVTLVCLIALWRDHR